MQTTTRIHLFGTDEPAPSAETLSGDTTQLSLLPGLDIFGPREQLVRLLRAGLDALTDGTVAWGPDGAEVVPLRRPGKRRVTIGVDDDQLAALARHVELAEAVEVANMPTARLARDILAAAAEPEPTEAVSHWPAEVGSTIPLCGADAPLGPPAPHPVTCPECLSQGRLDILGGSGAA